MRSRERWSFGVNDTGVLVSTSIAEALEDRRVDAEARASGLDGRVVLRPCETGISGAFESDGAALAAATMGAGGATAGLLLVDPVGSRGLCGAAP